MAVRLDDAKHSNNEPKVTCSPTDSGVKFRYETLATPNVAMDLLDRDFELHVPFVASLAAFFLNLHTQREMEALLLATRAIRVGESTTADVQRIVERFGGETDKRLYASNCPSADAAYDVRLAATPLNRIGWTIPFARRLGFRPWGVGAVFLLQQGHVCYAQYSAVVERAVGEPILMVSTTALPIGSMSFDPKYPHYGIGVRLHRGACRLRIEVGPEAMPTEQQHSFALNFSCVTSVRGCREVSQLAPVAWADLVSRSKEKSWIAEHGQDQGWEAYCDNGTLRTSHLRRLTLTHYKRASLLE